MNGIVAIIGRPNVGKSTLFNRLIGRRHALVDDTPGVTRDRRQGEAKISDLQFTIFDTAGLESNDRAPITKKMRDHYQGSFLYKVRKLAAGWEPARFASSVKNMLRGKKPPSLARGRRLKKRKK